MCGIFGIVLNKTENAKKTGICDLLINGLLQLQNRGYDSAGLCFIQDDQFIVNKYASTNSINALDKLISMKLNYKVDIGIGHNRWATHGMKTDINAHPHLSNDGKFVIVHNGIIENYNELKNMLIGEGFTFYSQTDTEVIVNLLQYKYKSSNSKDVFETIKKTVNLLTGTYGLLIQSLYEPNKLYCVRNGSPLLVGQNEEEVIITSEQAGFCNRMSNYITLHNDDICIITRQQDSISVNTIYNYTKKAVTLVETSLTPYPYEHWTLKEINEQPDVIINSINNGGRIKNQFEVKLGGLERNIDSLKIVQNIIILGCGTSYFAGLYGMHYFKQLCNFNTVQVYDGAEFSEIDIPKLGNTSFILISQSGETKDLHRCVEIAKNNNIVTIGIINVVDSLIARDVDCGIYCNAGKEVGVASTKAFTSQVVCLSMAAIWFSTLQGINEKKRQRFITDLHNLSSDIKLALAASNARILDIANKFGNKTNMFLLGKGSDEFIAKEGSLKIKEI
jgi:glucosamine--fructose-6-phosphate aminotransferase (isomerizing)